MTSPTDILEDNAQTYEQKEEDYGESWKILGQVLYNMAGGNPITIETEEDWIRIGLYTRRFDKLIRAFNGEFCSDELNFEAVVDSHEDECVYAAMAASLAENREKVKSD